MKKRVLSVAMALVLALSLLPVSARAATYDYAVDGGNIYFDPTTGTITGCDSNVFNADIPSEIYGVPVTSIDKRAFNGKKKLVSVTIPSTVTTIGSDNENGSPWGAFSYCENLTSITIPSSVTEIGESAFAHCTKLETIIIPGSVKILSKNLLCGCSNLKKIELGDGIEKICECSIAACHSLEELIIPDSVTTIERFAFHHGSYGSCENLKTITIGKGVRSIGEFAFLNCPSLESIYFRGDAPTIGKDIINKFAQGFTIYYPEGASGWTTPTWNGYITKPYNLPGVTPAPTPAPTPTPTPAPTPTPTTSGKIAYARTQTIDLDGKMLVLPTYALKDSNGNETNFVKLRDIAYVLNGTAAKFNVGWDGAVNITPRNDYAPDGTELKTPFSGDRAYKDNTAATKIDGVTVSLQAIVLTDDNGGGYTYYKLRDLGEALGFNVGYSSARGIFIESNKPYSNND